MAAVQAGIIGSADALARAGSRDAWVAALYQNLLGRTAGSSETSFWVGRLATRPASEVVLGFVQSDECRLLSISGWYQSYLGRAVDGGGRQFWLDQMRAGATPEFVQIAILASAEYMNRV